jgi:plastocyanin
MTTTRLTIGLAAAVLAVGVAAGCGGGSSSSSSAAPAGGGSASGGTVVEIDIADSGFAFVKSTATAPAGVVTLKAMNPQSTAHNISIKSTDGSINEEGQNVSDGGVSEVTVTLKPGAYTYFCSVPGHEEAGMKGTLTVT